MCEIERLGDWSDETIFTINFDNVSLLGGNYDGNISITPIMAMKTSSKDS